MTLRTILCGNDASNEIISTERDSTSRFLRRPAFDRNTPSPHFSPKSTPVRLAAFWSNRCQQTLFYVSALSNDIRVNTIKANRLLQEQSGGSCCIPMETTQRARLPTTLHLMTHLHAQQSEKNPPQIHNRAAVNYFNTNPLDVTLK